MTDTSRRSFLAITGAGAAALDAAALAPSAVTAAASSRAAPRRTVTVTGGHITEVLWTETLRRSPT